MMSRNSEKHKSAIKDAPLFPPPYIDEQHTNEHNSQMVNSFVPAAHYTNYTNDHINFNNNKIIPRSGTFRRFASDWSWTVRKNNHHHIYENLKNVDIESTDVGSENIYENVCEKCGNIYSGNLCDQCVKILRNDNKEKSPKQLKRNFTDFFASLKHRGRQRAEQKRTRKIEIIHNVDGFDNVFCTNKSFDLQEICHLKQNQNLYGKIRQNSDDHISKTTTNDTIKTNSKLSKSSPDLINENLKTTDNITETNFYENLDSDNYNDDDADGARVHTTTISNAKSIYDVVIANQSLAQWMTSLRWETWDYSENSVFNVKSIPSKSFDDFNCCQFSKQFSSDRRIVIGNNYLNKSCDNGDQVKIIDLIERVEDFKNSFFTNLKRREDERLKEKLKVKSHEPIIIVIKDNQENNVIDHQQQVQNVNDQRSVEKSEFLTSFLNVFDAFLQQNPIKISQYIAIERKTKKLSNHLEGKRQQQRTVRRNKLSVLSSSLSLSEKRNIFKYELLNRVILSVSLNRILLTFDKQLIVCVAKATKSHRDRQTSVTSDNHKKAIKSKKKPKNLVMRLSCSDNEVEEISRVTKPASTTELIDLKMAVNEGGNNLDLVQQKKEPDPDINLNIQHPIASRDSIALREDGEDPESVYQSIWKFHTVGIARESFASDTFDGSYNTDDFCEEIDAGEWELAEEFQYGTSLTSDSGSINDGDNDVDEDKNSIIAKEEITNDAKLNENENTKDLKCKQKNISQDTPFSSVCILYDSQNPKRNKMLFDYRGCEHVFKIPRKPSVIIEDDHCDANGSKVGEKPISGQKYYSIPDCVLAWKFMLLNINYNEDEEDVIMSETFTTLTEEEVVTLEHKTSATTVIQDTREKKLPKIWNPMGYLKNGRLDLKNSSFINYKSDKITVKKYEFGSVDNLTSIFKNSESPQQQKSPRFLRPLLPKSETSPVDKFKREDNINNKKIVFGPDLHNVKMDHESGVPKFVVECVRLVEQTENIKTNGIYRASGNKNYIENVRKKINERHNIRKDLIWQFLEKQDIHTLTGSLKLFFRSLTTQLISDDMFARLSEELENPDNLKIIKKELDSLPDLCRSTLKYLIKHLTVVTSHCEDNLMTSSNLSICWGACIFASSQSAFESFETGNIIKMNLLIKLLIDNYNFIFNNDDKT